MEKGNAGRFIDAFNRIDAQLRALYGRSGASFSETVTRCARLNSVVRRYEDDLIEYARLRNAIVHQSRGEIIAEPSDGATEEICRIAELLCSPPKIGERIPEKKICSIGADMTLRQTVRLISETGHSSLPVYGGGALMGIINSRRIVRALGAAIRAGGNADRFLSETKAGDILDGSDTERYYTFLSREDSLTSVPDAFEKNRKLLAVCVTENGRPDERIVCFVTPADLSEINRILENYR